MQFVVFDSDLGSDAAGNLAKLREWLDLTGFIRGTADGTFAPPSEPGFRMRSLYADVFEHVCGMERRHRAVCLIGTYMADIDLPLCRRPRLVCWRLDQRSVSPPVLPHRRHRHTRSRSYAGGDAGDRARGDLRRDANADRPDLANAQPVPARGCGALCQGPRSARRRCRAPVAAGRRTGHEFGLPRRDRGSMATGDAVGGRGRACPAHLI